MTRYRRATCKVGPQVAPGQWAGASPLGQHDISPTHNGVPYTWTVSIIVLGVGKFGTCLARGRGRGSHDQTSIKPRVLGVSGGFPASVVMHFSLLKRGEYLAGPSWEGGTEGRRELKDWGSPSLTCLCGSCALSLW